MHLDPFQKKIIPFTLYILKYYAIRLEINSVNLNLTLFKKKIERRRTKTNIQSPLA